MKVSALEYTLSGIHSTPRKAVVCIHLARNNSKCCIIVCHMIYSYITSPNDNSYFYGTSS